MQLMQSKRDKTLRVSLNSHWPASYSHTAALHNLRLAKVIVNMNGQCKCLYHDCINATSQSTPLFCQVKKKKKIGNIIFDQSLVCFACQRREVGPAVRYNEVTT